MALSPPALAGCILYSWLGPGPVAANGQRFSRISDIVGHLSAVVDSGVSFEPTAQNDRWSEINIIIAIVVVAIMIVILVVFLTDGHHVNDGHVLPARQK